MTKNVTPYTNKDNKSFWKTGVADIRLGSEQFDSLHRQSLSQNNPRISSLGSCFAQHVGRWLLESGYTFHQSEIEQNLVSSFAFGNIYTPRCLIQWLDIALSGVDLNAQASIYNDGSKHFDLLRPTFNENGFESHDALIQSRLDSCQEMKDIIGKTDVLVFTLGLTEAWKDQDGFFYPSCPGVVAGEFDERTYSFHNFGFEEIQQDLQEIRNRLKSINPDIQLMLTVSPVPLTATATDQHVMVASQYSKSVLRAVAGYMEAEFDDVVYFPSYEIITAPRHGDFRFLENLRTVTPEAVKYVMSHFRLMLEGEASANNKQSAVVDETVCEEEMLEAVRKLEQGTQEMSPEKLILIGDSHFGKLSTAFESSEIAHAGGMVMNGSGFSQRKFALCEDEYFVPLESAGSRKIWTKILTHLDANKKANVRSTILTNIGMQTHQNASRFISWVQSTRPAKLNSLSAQDMVDFFKEDQAMHISLLAALVKAGNEVIVVSDPPFSKYFEESKGLSNLIYGYFATYEQVVKSIGVRFYNAAEAFDKEGLNPDQYKSTTVFSDGSHDWYHGNEDYYSWLATKLQALIG